MTSKTTKRALLSSALSLILCLAMLIGTTFAWFTDSVESGINTIQAGNLDIKLYHTNRVDTHEEVTSTVTLFDDVTLWEPGAMAWEKLSVENAGNLALKYILSVNFANATATPAGKTLADALKVAVLDVEPTRENIKSAEFFSLESFTLASDKELLKGVTDTFYVAIYWVPTANDNDFNMNNGANTVLTIDLGVKLIATQSVEEADSFDNTYDKNAPKLFSVNDVMYNTAAEALAAATDGDRVTLSGATDPITINNAIELTIDNTNIVATDGVNAITVNANATIIANGSNTLVGGKDADGIHVAEGTKLVLSGKGALSTKGNAGLEYYRKQVKSTYYGESISNTDDSTYANKGGSGIDAKGILEIDGLANLVAEGYGIHGFGIGGSSDSITIKDSTISYARGGFVCANMFIPESWGNYYYGKGEPTGGAAIGSSSDGALINIINSTVKKAEGGSKAAGVGALYHTGVTIYIENSNVTAFGGNASAGIGGSRVVKDITAGDAITIDIKKSTIYAVGGDYAAGIGSGYNTYAENIAITPQTKVDIDAASNITAQGGKLGAGIGTGHNVINFVGNINCDTSKVKAGDNHDECCLGWPCSNVETIGNGAYRIDQLYTPIDDGFYTDNAGNYYVYTAAGLKSMRTWIDSNFNDTMWGKTYNIMADIDATGYSWETVHMSPDSATFNGIVFNGNGHTIKNLTIVPPAKPAAPNNAGLFTGATQGTRAGTTPSVFNDITFDHVTVNGGTHHNGVIWGEAHGSITLNNINVVNDSKISGGCNVGALIGRNNGNSTMIFNNCSVKNTTVEATKAADFAGASAFLGMALKIGNSTSIDLIFKGNNISEDNNLITADGMQGGGIYTKSEWGAETWENPIVVRSFTNYNSAQ